MYEEGGVPGNFSYISRAPPTLKRAFVYELFFVKLRDYLERWGGGPHTFSVFGFKSLFRKRWGGGFIHWFCKAMDVWCSWSFPGESYEIARRFKCMFKKVGLRCCAFFCESQCQGCVKWWQLANCVAGVGHRESVILRGRRSIWDNFVISIAAFSTGTAARGVMLPSSFVPFCVAGAMLVYAATCHLRRDPPHSTFHTFHYYIEHFTCLSTFCTPHFALRSLQCTVDIPHPQSTLYNLHFTLRTLYATF